MAHITYFVIFYPEDGTSFNTHCTHVDHCSCTITHSFCMFFSTNLEDVEYEWERIKTSKEILTNNKRRVRYDRLIAMLNPQQAMARTVSKIISNVVFGLFIPHCIKFGSFASKSIASNVLKTTQNIKENNNHMLQQHNNPFGLDLSMMQQQQQDNIDTLVETMSTVQQTAASHFKVRLYLFFADMN